MKDFILFLISSIVDNPDKIQLKEEKTESGFINYLLKVAPGDIGRIIGKKGQIIKAIRNLIRIKAYRDGKKVIFTLQEEEIPLTAD